MSADNYPLVSIVTPAYNQAEFLRETIESVLSQDYPRIEYLVLDDGSTDETPQVLAEYEGRVRWQRHANMGQTPTINKGWQLATGDVVTWLNSDDTFLPGAVRKGVEYLMSHSETGIVFGDSLFTEADGTPLERTKPPAGDRFDYLTFVVECENPIAQPSAFIRRAVVEDVGLLDPSYYYFMDWDFWLRAGARHRIDYIPELLSTYRLHAESKTVAQAARAAPELEYMYEKFFALEGLPAEVLKVKDRATANMLFTSGAYYLKGGVPEKASEVARRALEVYPGALASPRMLHKFLYCRMSESALYRKSRQVYRGARALLGSSG
jgi:glycosyltransferase involved in cell wall biosynthesis